MKAPQGIVAYRGPSLLTGAPVFVVTTNLQRASKNDKTGAMAQTFILAQDVAPHHAIKTGHDEAVCGDCRMRRYLQEQRRRAGLPVDDGPCYVLTFQSPRSVWHAYKDAPVLPPEEAREILRNARHNVHRVGSYGDPGAVPASVWSLYPRERTSYTHQWRNRPDLAPFCMASVHSESERAEARSMGFRTFRILGAGEAPGAGEILCPASEEAGKRTTCIDCVLCDGSRGTHDKRKDIAIHVH